MPRVTSEHTDGRWQSPQSLALHHVQEISVYCGKPVTSQSLSVKTATVILKQMVSRNRPQERIVLQKLVNILVCLFPPPSAPPFFFFFYFNTFTYLSLRGIFPLSLPLQEFQNSV